MEKITIKEFFDKYNKKGIELGIHCKTEKEAKILLKAFDKAGYKWFLGQNYTSLINFDKYEENTVYLNSRYYDHLRNVKIDKIEIYEFEDVDLEG